MRRSYSELWEQLKVIILYGGKRRYTKKELFEIMTNLEIGQLAKDPLGEILKTSKELDR